MKHVLPLISTLLLAPLAALQAADLILVTSGKSLTPIILPKGPTMLTKIAAADLADYIGKVGGVKPEILEGLPNPVRENGVGR